MDILILCRHDKRSDYDQIDTYRTALSSISAKANYSYGELDSLVFLYDGNRLVVTSDGRDISKYNAIFFVGWFKSKILEDIALSVATYANMHGLKVWNSEVLYTRSRSKLSQYVMAVEQGVSLTPFLFCKDTELLSNQLDGWDSGYPIIAKSVLASRGDDNYKLADRMATQDILRHANDKDGPWFVIQSFVPNEGDYRVIVMGDKVTMVIHRLTDDVGSHLNNTSKGGTASIVPVDTLPDAVRQQCIRLAQRLRREITGIDMIRNSQTGEFYLLEINNMPQLATGASIGAKMKVLDSYFMGRADD